MKACLPITVLASFTFALGAHAGPALRVLHNEPAASLLRNGDFEQAGGGKPVGWQPAAQGCRVVVGEGRSGSRALACENDSGRGWFGASQTIVLDRAQSAPLVVRGWSKAAGVSGSTDSDYALYVDLIYQDGTPLWGQTAGFRAGTHDWQERQFLIFPEKPVKSVTLNCLFRNRAGKVWFDDVSLQEVAAGSNAVLFQGAPVRPLEVAVDLTGAPRTARSQDGLRLDFKAGSLESLQLGARQFHDPQPAGFLVRDVAADSDFYALDREDRFPADLGLGLQVQTTAAASHVAIQGRISDTTGRDRAVTLVFALPVDATGWAWGDDLRRQRTIQGTGEFANQVSVHCGATGTQSLYPIAAVWDQRDGVALGLDMAYPAVYRLGYQAGLRRLFIAFDFGLARETERFPSSADFRLVLYRFDPTEGFRSAWQKYMEIFPEHFVVRSHDQGLWMPFTDVSRVQGWQDFGFRYHEGNNNVPWDDAHGVLSFRYTEPMTWWMSMAKDLPRTLPEALRVRDELERQGDGNRRRMAEISRRAAMFDETGQPALLFRNEPWANGAVWSLNPNPWLGTSGGARLATDGGAGHSDPALNAATVHWNPAITNRLYGPEAKGQLDGEYLDSLEGYVTTELNFRREHFRTTTVPLTFSAETKQLALFKGLAVYEFTRWLAHDVHAMNKLMFANGVPYRFSYLCPWLDVLGTETDWLRAGQYQPAGLATMDLWRTLSGGKPYLLLMNTDYDRFTSALVERYFQRALFYGMWPGFFSHNASENPYWQNPKWYERDRPLFRRYLPLIKRVAEAGWQPLTGATCQDRGILIERFGPAADGSIYLTFFNDTNEARNGLVALRAEALHLPNTVKPEFLLGDASEQDGLGWRVALRPGEARVWLLRK